MAEVKIMVVPGKIARVELTMGMTVLDACESAERLIPGVGWVELAKTREVRVQNRRFSNSAEVTAGFAGSIATTPLADGDIVLILTKIKGNGGPGLGVLTVTIDGQEYALETPERLGVVLANVAGYDLGEVETVLVNGGEESQFDQLVGAGDQVVVKFYGDDLPPVEEEEEYLLDLASEEPQAAELDPDQLTEAADRLYAQAEALRDLVEALHKVNAAKARLAKLGYEV